MTGTRSIDQMVEAAIWLMVQGDRAGAEELLTQVLRIDPTNERARQAMKSTGSATTPGQEAPKPPIPNQTNPVIPAGTFKIPPERTPLEPNPALERPFEAVTPQRGNEATTPIGAQAAPDPRRAEPPGLLRRGTLPGMGAIPAADEEFAVDDTTLPGSKRLEPFRSTPSSMANEAQAEEVSLEKPTVRLPTLEGERPKEKTDRHLSLVPPRGAPQTTSSTQPQLERITGTNPAFVNPQQTWSLEVLTGPHTGKNLPVPKRPMVIGKGLGVLDVEEDFFMSPGHASLFQRGGDLYISDGGSSSGTWVSLDAPTRINPGDSFSAGLQRFRYLGPLENPSPEMPWGYGAPRPAASWRLEHVLVGNRPGRTWVLRGVITIGRDGTHLRFGEDDSMASTHVELRPAGQQLEVVDRSARIGTFVSLPLSGEARLREGMRIRLGSTVFRVMR
ncbi:MAG: hypothetical protein U0228_01235 [Myxococcaceae bacterium]